jgi:hypothetical protein
MTTVYFKNNGRFGNNIFQYFAAEIIKSFYNFKNTILYENENIEFTKIDDVLFKNIGNEYIKNKIVKIAKNNTFNGLSWP